MYCSRSFATPVVPQPGARRTEAGEEQDRRPRYSRYIFPGRCARCRRYRPPRPDAPAARRPCRYPASRSSRRPGTSLASCVANGEELTDEGADRGVGQRFRRDDQMIDADGLDLVLGAGRRGREDAAGNLLGFIERVLLGDRLRNLDRQEFRLAPAPRPWRRSRPTVILLSSGPTAMKASSVAIARHLGDLVGGELGDRHLVGVDAGLRSGSRAAA